MILNLPPVNDPYCLIGRDIHDMHNQLDVEDGEIERQSIVCGLSGGTSFINSQEDAAQPYHNKMLRVMKVGVKTSGIWDIVCVWSYDNCQFGMLCLTVTSGYLARKGIRRV